MLFESTIVTMFGAILAIGANQVFTTQIQQARDATRVTDLWTLISALE